MDFSWVGEILGKKGREEEKIHFCGAEWSLDIWKEKSIKNRKGKDSGEQHQSTKIHFLLSTSADSISCHPLSQVTLPVQWTVNRVRSDAAGPRPSGSGHAHASSTLFSPSHKLKRGLVSAVHVPILGTRRRERREQRLGRNLCPEIAVEQSRVHLGHSPWTVLWNEYTSLSFKPPHCWISSNGKVAFSPN